MYVRSMRGWELWSGERDSKIKKSCVFLLSTYMNICVCVRGLLAIREAEDSNEFITKLRAKTEENRATNEQTVS